MSRALMDIGETFSNFFPFHGPWFPHHKTEVLDWVHLSLADSLLLLATLPWSRTYPGAGRSVPTDQWKLSGRYIPSVQASLFTRVPLGMLSISDRQMNLEMANELQEATLFYPSLHILKVCCGSKCMYPSKLCWKSYPGICECALSWEIGS